MKLRISNVITVLVLAAFAAVAQAPGAFTTTGNMTTPRARHTATLLPDGMVLIAGGVSSGYIPNGIALASAEIYDPSTGTFTATGNMTAPRAGHAAVLLENGKVLVVGGWSSNDLVLASAELYDPVTRSFSAAGNMTQGRCGGGHFAYPSMVSGFLTATLLGNGKVLIAGGEAKANPAPRAELYDPATGAFAATGEYAAGSSAAAALLADGRVLFPGGPSQIYSPDTGTFSLTASTMPGGLGSYPEVYTTASLLANSKVLVVTRFEAPSDDSDTAELWNYSVAELYDPPTGTVTITGDMTNIPPYLDHAATLLPDGSVLISGPSLIYDPPTGTSTSVGGGGRASHTATLLRNGTVLIAGGGSYLRFSFPPPVLSTAELFNPVFVAKINSGGIVSGSTFQAAPNNSAAPGGLISIFGRGLAPGAATAPSLPLPAALNGTTVLINNVPAPLFFVSPGQINAQVPFSDQIVPGKTYAVRVLVPGQYSPPQNLQIDAVAPGIFTVPPGGTGQGAVLNLSGKLVDASVPAKPGDTVAIFASGLGVTNPPLTSGAAGNGQQTVNVPAVTVGGQKAAVSFSGAAPGFAALYQINVIVPDLSPGSYDVVITTAGKASAPGVKITVGK